MNSHPELEKFLAWLLNHSVQAGVLVVLVLLIQWIFRAQLASRWRFALWWIVLVRLLLPVGPQSAISLFNYFHPPVSVASSQYNLATPISNTYQPPARLETSPVTSRENAAKPNPAIASPKAVVSQPISIAQPTPAHLTPTPVIVRPRNLTSLILPVSTTIWFGGMAVLAAYVLIQILRFQWRLSRSADNAEPALSDLLHDCQREFGVRRRIELLETDAVGSLALFGLFRLRLLLPKGFAGKFNRNELRYIFLHELAHVRRGDLWLNWLITALQIVHWFNPLIWFGFARLRSDRELACDELALLHAGEKTGTSYGETVVKLLEGLSRPAAIPGLVGILEDKQQMRRRILMIANFKRPGRWSALAILLLAFVAVATLTDAQTGKSPASIAAAPAASPKLVADAKAAGGNRISNLPEEDAGTAPRPDLIGDVRVKGGGPLAATVFISTAAPKTGTSTFCPSCYFDCSKSAKADAQGQFTIKSLNPQLVFRILAVAKGYKPKFVPNIDPAEGPVTIELEPITAADAPPDRSLRGRVLDPKGNPIAGATVEMKGIQTKDGGGTWGSIPGIDPLAVTDEDGEFLITAQKPFEMMDVMVEARLYAPKSFAELSSGDTRHDLTVAEGASVTGRVLLNGKPLNGISVGVSAVERTAGNYLGHYEVGTAADGKFVFLNVPPNADFYIYSLMNTTKEFGAVPIQKFHTGADGAATEVGDLIVGPAYRLQGRVVLSDGQPVPPKTRLLVSREGAWDSMQLTLEKDGGFETKGIPAEVISLSARVANYRVSPENKSLDRLSFRVIGRVDRDITGLIYLLEKGPNLQPDYSGGITESDLPQHRPLRGAEGGVDHSRDWTISGRVIDSVTRQPIAHSQVTPGETDTFQRLHWDLHSVESTNRSYVVYLGKRVSLPLLKAEAEGYLPASVTVQAQDSTNVEIVLTKGTGPSGTVVDSNGKPAVGVTLALLCDGMDQGPGLDSKGELKTYWNKERGATTDSNGHFSFKPQLAMRSVAAASSNGFAMVSIEKLAADSEIRLEPFGKITGTLARTSALGTNENLDLTITEKDGRGVPRLNLNNHVTTDSQGRFTFEGVPPGRLQLSYRVPMGEHSWQNEPIQELEVKPGQTLDLQIKTGDRKASQQDFAPAPQPKRIPGEFVKGTVLSPAGKPVADVDVAVQVDGMYLALEKGALSGNSLRENGLLVSSKVDGSFALPMYEGATSVVALNEEGFAQVSLEQFKASPKITLQKWGRVEGTLQINHHPGSNETIGIDAPNTHTFEVRKIGTNETVLSQTTTNRFPTPTLHYGFNAAKTDQHGHFAVSFIPPGENTITRLVSNDNGRSWTHRPLGTVNVKAGEVTIFDFTTAERTVTGKLTFSDTNSLDLENSMAFLNTPMFKLIALLQAAKTAEERKALMESDEFQKASKDRQQYPAKLQPDGTFLVEDVTPGKYEFSIQPGARGYRVGQMPTNWIVFDSVQTIVVPPVSDKNDDAPVDAGSVDMKPFNISPLPGASGS